MRVVALTVGFALAGSAATPQTVADALELNRQKIETQKRFLVGGALPLSDAEGRAFWPLYEECQGELRKLGERSDRLIADYVAAYSSLADSQAEAMLDEMLRIEEDRLRLKRRWMARMAKVLPPRKLARYFQLESKLEAVVRADLARQIPLLP